MSRYQRCAVGLTALSGVALLVGCAGFHRDDGRRQLDQFSHDLIKQWDSHPFLIIGEIHGTNEAPAIVSKMLEARDAGTVLLALEIDSSEQERIDNYLGSPGDTESRALLLQGKFWTKKDGRASDAMFGLVERVRELKKSDHRISIVCFDNLQPGATRDESMARLISTVVSSQSYKRILVLTGNLHARLSASETPGKGEKMAWFLRAKNPVSLSVVANSGFAWNCVQTCGVNPISSKTLTNPEGVFVHQDLDEDGYLGVVRLTTLSPSLPVLR